MQIKVAGLRLDASLLIPLGILFVIQIFFGRALRILRIEHGFDFVWFTALTLIVTSIFVLRLNLGGLLAAIFALVLATFQLGVFPGILALAIAIIYILIVLDETSRAAQIPSLRWQEWLATLGIVWVALCLSFGSILTLPPWFAAVVVGFSSGAIATIGLQLKQAELTFRQTALLVGGTSLVAISLGLIQASLTIFPSTAT
jgi:hypothetical protein